MSYITIFRWFIPVVCDYNIYMYSVTLWFLLNSPCQTWWWPYRKGPKHVVFRHLNLNKVLLCFELPTVYQFDIWYWDIRNSKFSVPVACSILVGLRTFQHPCVSFIVVDITWLNVKNFWLLFGLTETDSRMSIILIDCAIYSIVACA